MTKYFNIKSLRISKKTYFFVSGGKEVNRFYYCYNICILVLIHTIFLYIFIINYLLITYKHTFENYINYRCKLRITLLI